jgi:signal transduction histidine kinase/DNA-binding response OmpR family regulator
MDSGSPANVRNFDFLAGGGEMGERMRALDWANTPLGPAEGWPQSLKTIVRVMLDSRYAMWMLWGPELTFFCNDAYLPTVGMKRNWVLGARSDKVWEEIWPDIGPRIERVLEEGRATWDEGLPLFLERYGFAEETYHTFSYSPIYDDDSRIAGMLCVVTEVTERVIGERRLRVLRDLATSPRAEATEEACKRLINVLADNPLDVSFACLYLLDQTQECLKLGHYYGRLPQRLLPAQIALADRRSPWPISEAIRSGAAQIVELPQDGPESITGPLWPDPIHRAIVLPVKQGLSMSSAVLIAGLSPRRPLDDGYRGFLDLVVRQFAAAIADAQTYEAERARAQALAEIDRAKTAFFSNVSHEFRTPLTLLLGPLEEALQKPSEGLRGEALQSAHRNALRLLRLVNALLDFSRIEAGRAQAHYVATDLAGATRELASVFHSAMDRAGLRYSVTCSALPEPVYIDREMWEKIVLNLVSNAFKFTFDGEIRVEVRTSDGGAELLVADTGTGIPSDALPQLFNRFYRVPGAHGRTHEGSGIGLSLVRELVTLHGGSIAVESNVGRGSIFRVYIPYGVTHLPGAQVAQESTFPAATGAARSFVAEAQRWLPEVANLEQSGTFLALAGSDPPTAPIDERDKPTVLVVDDNRDMREYVTRLLSPRFVVSAAEDGQSALDLIDSGVRPELVLSDLMMPRLDGFGLLRALRSRPVTETTPVIFLSARAGEEARIEGFDIGADDYLVKPFSARELITRIDTHIRLSRLRRAAGEQTRASEERLQIAINEAGMGTWDLDLRTHELRWSRSHYALLGLEPGESSLATDELWRNRIYPADRETVEAALSKSREIQTLYSQEYRIVRADTGAVRWLRVLGRFLYDESGVATRSVGVSFDDTERKAAEIALLEADQRKDVFLATLAHELRNPLAPIRNAAQVLGSSKLGSEQLQWAQNVIQRQVKHMAWLLDDLLDVARITQGKLELKQQHISLNSVVDSAVETARPLLDSKSHRLVVTLPAEPVTLDADPLRLSQVLSNLLTNAAKYTHAGGEITLSGRIENGKLALSIKDNGIGIPAESLNGIFAMFSQVEGAAAHSEGGLGIGLALVKGLTELHGGTVEAKSEGLGRGSEFILTIPIVAGNAVATPMAAAQGFTPIGRRVLVADDNQDAAESLSMILEMAGHEVRVVHDGLAALSAAQSFRPDTVLLDIGMPQMNGYEVARALRREPWGTGINLVALTGWGQESDRQKAMDAGFDHHLTKPVDPDALEALLRSPRRFQ